MTDSILSESTNSPAASLTSEPEKLLPCPFCGGEAKRFTIEEEGDNFGGDVIACTGVCGASSHVEFGRKENLVSLWNTRLSSPVSGTDGRERLALEAIKAVTATTKDAVRGLSRIMAITRSAGVDAPYSDLMAKPDVALIVNSPRTEWRNLFERREGRTIPPEGWSCSRAPGHDGPCAASPSTPIPVIAEAGEREPLLAREIAAQFYDKRDPLDQSYRDVAHNIRRGRLDNQDAVELVRFTLAHQPAATPATLDNTAVEGQDDNTLSFLVEPEFLFSAGEGDCACCGGPHCFTMRVRPIGPDGEPIIGRWDRSYDNAEDVISDFLWRKQDGRLVNRSDDDLVFHAGNRPGDKGYYTGSGNMFRITVSPATLTAKTEKAK